MKRIINSIKKILTLDNSSSQSYEHSLQRKTLFFFSVVIFLTLFIIAVLNAFIFPDSATDAIILFCSSLFCLISIYLNIIDKYIISATMIMIAIFLGIVFNMASSNGIYDPGATALVIFIIISSLFYNRIYVIFFTFLSIIAYTTILVFQYFNYIGKQVPYLIFDGSVFIILILITGFLFWIVMGNNTNMLSLVAKSLKEKDILLKELYHRTRNNMQVISSMLDIQSFQSQNDELKHFYNDMKNRIKSMSLVHQQLYQFQDLSNISLKDYINELVETLSKSYESKRDKVFFELDIQDIKVLIDIALPFGLAITELISNSLEHAFNKIDKGIINIKLQKLSDGHIEFQIADNGEGVPNDFDFKKCTSLGVKNIFSIIELQLDGTVKFTVDNGLRCTLLFKDSIYTQRVRNE